uniref:RXLR phytopathogen effector protein WY-domain domain-containing protein n=1 Tax=Peronospora matthiolae TaxID=2874970 RepID=A0AAV1TD58_9STRA
MRIMCQLFTVYYFSPLANAEVSTAAGNHFGNASVNVATDALLEEPALNGSGHLTHVVTTGETDQETGTSEERRDLFRSFQQNLQWKLNRCCALQNGGRDVDIGRLVGWLKSVRSYQVRGHEMSDSAVLNVLQLAWKAWEIETVVNLLHSLRDIPGLKRRADSLQRTLAKTYPHHAYPAVLNAWRGSTWTPFEAFEVIQTEKLGDYKSRALVGIWLWYAMAHGGPSGLPSISVEQIGKLLFRGLRRERVQRFLFEACQVKGMKKLVEQLELYVHRNGRALFKEGPVVDAA